MMKSMSAGRMGATAIAAVLVAGLLGAYPMARATSAAAPLMVDNFQLADQNFLGHRLYQLADAKAVVLITFASGDPAVRRDASAWMGLKAAYAPKGVEFLALASRLGETRERALADAKAAGLEMPILFDYQQLVGEQLAVTRAAEVVVIDPKTWRVAWRGPVAGPAGEPWARDAIEAVSSGRPVTAVSRPALGQAIAFPDLAHARDFAQISYAQSIAPIIQEKCSGCHQPGGIGPMPFNTYEQIKGFAPMIREVLRTPRMPPFEPDRAVGHFKDDGRLSPEQLKTLVHWVDAGAPRGAGEDPLRKIRFAAPEWPLGKPDLIVDIPEVKIPASGILEYQYPVVPHVMTEGRWLKATAWRLSDRKAVHHILTGVAPDDDLAPGATANETRWTTLLHGYVPGLGYMVTAEGTGLWVPPAASLAFQAHYTTYGRETVENTQVGLYFYPKGQEPMYPRRTFGIFNMSIEIPAGEAQHKEMAYIEFPKEAVIYAFTPHAHKRGVASTVSVLYPDGKEELLLAVPQYDFGWQYDYVLDKPITVPAGSKIIARWIYDNSARNPGNPDPTKTVYWGEQSFEEMLATYVHYHWVGETAKAPRDDYDKLMQANMFMGMLDSNMDGKIELAELKGGPQSPGQMLKKYFSMIDTDHDGSIDAKEMAAAMKLLPRRGGGPAKAPAPAAQPAALDAAAKPGGN